MSEPLVLVILLGASPDPTADGMMAAARRALGPDAVVLADTSPVTTDAEALAIGARVHARAIARVSWTDASRRTALLHVHVAPASEWADDELSFAPQDAGAEKARTVGYALATMVQRIEREHAEGVDRAPASEPAKGGESTSPPPAAPAAPAASSAPPLASREQDASVEAQRRGGSSADLEPGIDVLAYGTGALGGGATSAGGAAAIRWWPVPRFGVRAAIGGRAGTIPEADAQATTLFAAAGPSYRVPVGRALELGARAEVVVLQHAVSRRQLVETTHARWLTAADLVIEAGWALGPHAGLFVGIGAELAFGTTAVRVGGIPAANIPPARGIGEVGVRFRF